MALRADVDRAKFLTSCASGLEWLEKAACKHQCEQSWKEQPRTLPAQADGAKSNFSIQGNSMTPNHICDLWHTVCYKATSVIDDN